MKQVGYALQFSVDAGGLPPGLQTDEMHRILGHSNANARDFSCPRDYDKPFAYLLEELQPPEAAGDVPRGDRFRVPLLWDRRLGHGRTLSVLVADIAFVESADGKQRVMRIVENVPQQMSPEELQALLQQSRSLIPLLKRWDAAVTQR